MSWIPDSKVVDSGYPQAKIAQIPDSGLPYMGRAIAKNSVGQADLTSRYLSAFNSLMFA